MTPSIRASITPTSRTSRCRTWAWDDYSEPLVRGISTFGDKLIGIPFDIPIFILMYRKDLLDKHGLQIPTTMDDYMNVVRALDEAERGNGIYSTTRPAQVGALLPQLRLDSLALGQRRLGLQCWVGTSPATTRTACRALRTCWSW